MNRRIVLIFALASPVAALAHSYNAGGIKIGHAWALPSTLNDGQVFMPLLNEGSGPDALLAARSPICTTIELRKNVRYDDPPEARIAMQPGQPLPMRPGARHLRLMGLAKPLAAGDRFPLILDFEQAGEIEIEVHVELAPGD